MRARIVVDDVVAFGDHFAGLRMDHALGQQAAVQTAGHGLSGHIVRAADPDAVVRFAVVFVDDDVLGDIHQAAGQVTGVCRTQGGIGQTFAGAVGRDEVFQRRQALAEVRADRAAG